jgi:D-alanyl-D-alanine carboxypeptidase
VIYALAILGKAEPFTETVARGDRQLYRARFSDSADREEAEAVCTTLKRLDVPCFAMMH